MSDCKYCDETKKSLAEWRRYIGTTPELTWWRAGLYQFGKKFSEWAPTAAIVALVAATTGGVLLGIAWLANYPVAFAFVGGAASSLSLFQISSILRRRGY